MEQPDDVSPLQPETPAAFQPELEANPSVAVGAVPGEVVLPEKPSLKPLLRDLIETLILSVLLFLVINGVTARIRVESVSMQPTLYEGELVLVNRVAYKLGQPRRGDVVVFDHPADPVQPYIKRIVGLPGDLVEVQGGQVLVNGKALWEPYLKEAPAYTGRWEIPEDSLFVLGDNRNDSSDSHVWGMVDMENVIGRAEVVYWPVSEWQFLSVDSAGAANSK